MTYDYMCPFCVKPWKCNGPHIEPEDMAEFEEYSRSQYDFGFRDALDAAEQALLEVESDMSNWSSDETRAVTDVAPELTADQWIWAQRGVGRSVEIIRALREKKS